jgi:hypothetical protein
LLAPDIVEAILEGRQGPDVTLARLMDGFPKEWEGQRESFRHFRHFQSNPRLDPEIIA